MVPCSLDAQPLCVSAQEYYLNRFLRFPGSERLNSSGSTCQHPTLGMMPGFTYGIRLREQTRTGYIRTHDSSSEDTENRDDMRLRRVE